MQFHALTHAPYADVQSFTRQASITSHVAAGGVGIAETAAARRCHYVSVPCAAAAAAAVCTMHARLGPSTPAF